MSLVQRPGCPKADPSDSVPWAAPTCWRGGWAVSWRAFPRYVTG